MLANMVSTLADLPSARLLKHIVRCYLRLSENPRQDQTDKNQHSHINNMAVSYRACLA